MAPFVDRIAELNALDAALAAACALERAAVVTIEGPCGIGKSSLLEAWLARASAQARTARVQAQRLDRLGTEGLRADLDAGATVVGVDDAQWLNRPCSDVLTRAAQDGRLRLIVLAFDDNPPPLSLPVDARIVLAPLSDDDLARIVENRVPQLSPQAVRRIAAAAAGSPYEASILAALGGEATTAGGAIARFISELPLHARTLAQMLALVAAPVDAALMRALAPDARERSAALKLLAPLAHAYDGDVAFDHVLIASAIAETIPMKIPLHRRIIAAIERIGIGSLKERMMLVEQLLGAGDRAAAQRQALDLAFEAEREGAPYAQLWASTRHLELGEPPNERFVEFYVQFVTALHASGERERAEAIASHALSEAQRRGIAGIVPLAALLIQAQWAQDRQAAAHASYERYAQSLTDSNDLAQLRAAAPWIRAS